MRPKTKTNPTRSSAPFTQDLLEQEQILAAAQLIAHVGSWHMDLTASDLAENDLECSPAACELFGKKKTRMKATDFFKMIHPEDRDRFTNTLNKAINKRKPLDMQYRIKDRRGEIRHVRQRAQVMPSSTSGLQRVIGTVQDITELVEKNEALAKRAAELELLNQTMINRELKMIELKREIMRLRSELQQ